MPLYLLLISKYQKNWPDKLHKDCCIKMLLSLIRKCYEIRISVTLSMPSNLLWRLLSLLLHYHVCSICSFDFGAVTSGSDNKEIKATLMLQNADICKNRSLHWTLLLDTLMSGWTQQFVCPYIVSGLNVAAIRNTFFPDNALNMS